jgi:hypothetical protein
MQFPKGRALPLDIFGRRGDSEMGEGSPRRFGIPEGQMRIILAVIAVAGLTRPQASSAALIYTDVTAAMGIVVPGLGSGAAWSDLDADGDLDLLVSTSSGMITYLYRNDGDVFTNVIAGSGLSSEARNFAVGDYDNDGLDDLSFISFGYIDAKLYHNIGGMLFDDVSDTAPVFGTYSWRCSWADYNDDGYLDLFLCGSTAYLFRNNGDGTFQECAASAGIQAGGNTCAWVDYDNDGLEDCYVGCDGPDKLYHNLGEGTFEEVAAEAGVDDPNDTSGACAGDFDGDGYFDLYAVNIASPRNTLYHNLGDGTFQDVTMAAGAGDVGDGRTGTFLDIDFDGLVDIFASNHVNPNRLYRNNGDGTFTDIAAALGMDQPMDPFGTAFGDYDGDGDTDLFLATHFGNALLRCEGVTNHWMQVHLTGVISNKDAIGAVVRCIVDGQSEYLRVDGGHGMGDSDSEVLTFGLGASPAAVDIEVYWPSGITEFLDASGLVDTHIDITEGFTGIPGSGPTSPCGPTILGITPNPAAGVCIVKILGGQQSPESARLDVFDSTGRLVHSVTTQLFSGICAVPLQVSGMPPGVYMVLLSCRQETSEARFVVLP